MMQERYRNVSSIVLQNVTLPWGVVLFTDFLLYPNQCEGPLLVTTVTSNHWMTAHLLLFLNLIGSIGQTFVVSIDLFAAGTRGVTVGLPAFPYNEQ